MPFILLKFFTLEKCQYYKKKKKCHENLKYTIPSSTAHNMEIGTTECESCPIRGISSLCHFSKCIEASNILASFLLVLALVAGIMESLQCQPKRCFPFFTRRRRWHPTRQFCLDRKWRKGLNRREFNERITSSGLSRFQGSVTVES